MVSPKLNLAFESQIEVVDFVKILMQSFSPREFKVRAMESGANHTV